MEGSLISFFPNQRRKMRLMKFSPKRNTQNEKRLRLDFAMPLTGQGVVGMPKEVRVAFDTVANLDNGMKDSTIEAVIEPQTIEIYATDSSSRRAHLITAAELQDLFVVRPAVSDSKDASEVELRFHTTVQGSEELLLWAYKHFGMTFWGEFEPTQGEIRDLVKNGKKGKADDQIPLQSPEAKAASDATPTENLPRSSKLVSLGSKKKAPKVGKEAAAGKDD